MREGAFEAPVVVVGLNPTGLGLVRGLAPHCARIVALESNRDEPSTRTRLCEVRWLADLGDHRALGEELAALPERLGRKPVLFLSTDEHVLWALDHRDTLEGSYHLLLPPAEVCRDLMLKDRFVALAGREGWPIPAGAFLPVDRLATSIEAAGLRYPVILKPAVKHQAWDRLGLGKACIARDPEETRAVAARARGAVGELLAQEYLEGGDGRVFFCLYLAASGLAAPLTFCGRKILQWPPLRGSTAACEPVEAPALEAFTRALFGRLGVEGFASLEVKYLPDGSFKIIEPTIGRADLQSPLATFNGMNLPVAAYLAAQGHGTAATPFIRRLRSDVAWVYESSLFSLVRSGALDARSLLGLLGRRKGFALASWSDPGVVGAFAAAKVAAAVRRARSFATF